MDFEEFRENLMLWQRCLNARKIILSREEKRRKKEKETLMPGSIEVVVEKDKLQFVGMI